MTAISGDESSEPATASVLATDRRARGDIWSRSIQEPWTPRTGLRYGGRRLLMKRMVDLAIAGPMLLATAPLLALIAILIRGTSSGPAIYQQVRVGRRGRNFTILKFRTMHDDADQRLRQDPELWSRYLAGGFKLGLDDDPRITRLGRFLRQTSLDELPQLINVIRGDMSLVGPRPVVPEELEQYGGHLDAYLMAFPGLTGAWQVAGRDAVDFPGRARLDADYVDQWSLGGDLRILLNTIPAAITARDVR